MKISRSVVEAVRSLDPPGRFLEKDQSSGKWFDIGDKKAVEKTSQALRDGAASLRKQLSQDLSDPDFLSAVFDMDVVQPDKPPCAVPKKKVPAKKCHRRVKSNPSELTSLRVKNIMPKQQRNGEITMSPRPRSSICAPISGKPPQSPMSPRSTGGSPRPVGTYSMGMEPNTGHRRVYSQGSAPVHAASRGSPVNFGGMPYPPHAPTSRSTSFDYHEPPEHRRPHSARFGSPSPHNSQYPPHLMSPSNYSASQQYGGQQRPYHPSVSPRWSPRSSGYAKFAPPSLSPHPYMHPDDYHRRQSPDRQQIRRTASPREQQYHHPHPHYPPQQQQHHHGGHSHNLAVPVLGGESTRVHRQLPMSPRQYHPASPHHRASPRGSPLPVDFTPPQTFSRRIDSHQSNHNQSYGRMPMQIDEDHMDEKKQDEQDERAIQQEPRTGSRQETAPFDEKFSSTISPSAVADVARSHDILKQESLKLTPSHEKDDDDYPSDEEQDDPADDRLSVSPLPFDHHEDPSSLMELPENLLTLPISPCGPNDGEI